MKQMRCWIIAGSVAVLAAAIVGHAQSDTASLTVTVSDRSGQRVSGANVTITQTSTGVTREIKSSSEGVARLDGQS